MELLFYVKSARAGKMNWQPRRNIESAEIAEFNSVFSALHLRDWRSAVELLFDLALRIRAREQRVDLLSQRIQSRFEHGIQIKVRISEYLLPDFGELVGEPVLNQAPRT